MSGIELYAHAAYSGEVFGVRVGMSPAECAHLLGDDFVDQRNRRGLRRDYGLIELSFSGSRGEWRCEVIALQVHRLSEGPEGEMPAWMFQQCGPFPEACSYADLFKRIGELGGTLKEETGSYLGEFRSFVVQESGVAVLTLHGEVWSLNITASGSS